MGRYKWGFISLTGRDGTGRDGTRPRVHNFSSEQNGKHNGLVFHDGTERKVYFFTTGRDGKYNFSRRYGTVTIILHDGTGP